VQPVLVGVCDTLKSFPAISYPYPPYAWRLARRSAILWILLRLVLLAVTGVILPSIMASAVVVGITATLVWLEGRRLHEHLFHANLRTSPDWAIGISLVVAGLLEVLAQLLLRSLA
jgi:hypothetical protein